MSYYVFWDIYKQHVSSFNYRKIRTTGAVLVAISIPIFTSQLEKSREAVDAANLRAAYAEVMSDVVSGATTISSKTVDQKQTQAGWQTTIDWPDGMAVADIKAPSSAASENYWTVEWDATNKKIVAK